MLLSERLKQRGWVMQSVGTKYQVKDRDGSYFYTGWTEEEAMLFAEASVRPGEDDSAITCRRGRDATV